MLILLSLPIFQMFFESVVDNKLLPSISPNKAFVYVISNVQCHNFMSELVKKKQSKFLSQIKKGEFTLGVGGAFSSALSLGRSRSSNRDSVGAKRT